MDKIILKGRTTSSLSLKGRTSSSLSLSPQTRIVNSKWGSITGDIEEQNDLIEYIAEYVEEHAPEHDLSNYYTKDETYDRTAINGALDEKADISSLATVATSASYNDLIDTPIIPAAQLQSDWNQTDTGAKDYIKNKPTIPSKTSDLVNDSGYITNAAVSPYATNTSLNNHINDNVKHITNAERTTWNNKSDFSGDYDDLTNKPTIPVLPTNVSEFNNDAGYLTEHQDISGKANTSDLATVATSGDYDDLTNKPTIPTVPTDVSSFTNDAGYLTQHQDISGKANKSEMSVVDGTGTDADKTTITLKTGTSATVLKSHQSLSGKQDVIDSSHKLSADLVDDANSTHKFVTTQEKTTWNNKSDFSGSYNDLTNKPKIPAAQIQSDWNATSGMGVILNKPTIPTVPTNVSAFTNDAGYLTSHQDISGKEDKMPISTKSSNFTATVGNYYKVIIGASVSRTITLTIPSDSTKVSNCIFFVTTSTSPSLTIGDESGIAIYYSDGYTIEANSAYEINALWNGANWYITSVKFNIPSIIIV